jgi:hypothetical protein
VSHPLAQFLFVEGHLAAQFVQLVPQLLRALAGVARRCGCVVLHPPPLPRRCQRASSSTPTHLITLTTHGMDPTSPCEATPSSRDVAAADTGMI